MPKLNLRGVFIRYIDIRHNEGGIVTRIRMTADYSQPVCERMEWPQELSATMESAKLDGELILRNFNLSPNDKELKIHAIDIFAHDAGKFEVVRVSDGGDASHVELRFQIRSASEAAPGLLANYIAKIGETAGLMKMDFDKQTEMDLSEDKQTTLRDDEGEVILKGEAAEEHAKLSKSNRPALASASEMKRRTRGQQPEA